ncbi:hypothetical protein [Arthrobacter sp. MMS18-M83]|uniref:hypothetical protein n=1 Tax=Arthrobacter sp. MMS18-M83 TaxID=2996261 RepID=UPI003FA347C7
MARTADDLNADGVATRADGKWYASTIRRVLGSTQARELAGESRTERHRTGRGDLTPFILGAGTGSLPRERRGHRWSRR